MALVLVDFQVVLPFLLVYTIAVISGITFFSFMLLSFPQNGRGYGSVL